MNHDQAYLEKHRTSVEYKQFQEYDYAVSPDVQIF